MKISTTWSQDDWNKALKKVWQLSRNFEEILEFGLEHGFITSADIIHASDIYRDPNKEYDEGYFLELTKEELEKKYKISDNAEIYKFYKDIIDNKMIVAIADDPEYYSLKIIEKDKLIDNEVLLFIPEFAETPLSLDRLKVYLEL